MLCIDYCLMQRPIAHVNHSAHLSAVITVVAVGTSESFEGHALSANLACVCVCACVRACVRACVCAFCNIMYVIVDRRDTGPIVILYMINVPPC